jgi:hypothetical protein
MRILALDLGRRMGVAYGDSATLGKVPPRIEAVTIRGISAEKRAGALGDWLAALMTGDRYDLIVTESPMNPAASKSDHSTIDQLYYHGCLHGIAGIFKVPVETAPVMAVRKHFCGVAHAPCVRGRKRTAAEARAAREFINSAVLRRAILLGYLPEDSKGWDEANAAALWDFGCSKYARAAPAALALFEART